jgi:hypothetical protein
MSSAKTMKFPDKISSDDKLMAPQRLYNDVIDVLEEGVKWVASCIQSGERTVKVLSQRDVLWYTTCHHKMMKRNFVFLQKELVLIGCVQYMLS